MSVLVTHTDLDGIGCALLFLESELNRGDVAIFYEGYDSVNSLIVKLLKTVPTEEPIYITDLSVTKEVARKLNDRGNVTLLDHHKTAVWLNGLYDWATVDVSKCSTRLLFDYLVDNGLLPRIKAAKFSLFVHLVDDYDRWIHSDPRSKDLNLLLAILGRERFLGRFRGNPDAVFNDTETFLLYLEKEKIRRYAFETPTWINRDEEGRRYGVCFAEQYVSELGNRLLDIRALDYVVILDLRNKTVHLRACKGLDITPIAVAHGGGGHPRAAGYNIAPQQIREVINLLWKGGKPGVAGSEQPE